MAMPSPADVAKKWADNASRSTQAYIDGINRTQVNPMEEAAKNATGYLNGIQEAVASGKWQRGLRRMTQQEWADRAVKLGATRIAAGVTAGKAKMTAFLDQFLPHVAAGVQLIKNMPKSNLQERIARSVAMMEHLAKFKRT